MMTRTLILAKMTMMENYRKQVFHVVMLLTLTIVCASTLLSFFTMGIQIKLLKDLCMTSILFCGGFLAVALAATAIPGEVESRTCQPILARPIRRSELVLGKYIGTLLTIYAGLAFIGIVFAVLLISRQAFDGFMLVAIGFSFLEVALIAAVTMLLSTFTTPAVAVMTSFLVYVGGMVKIGYFKPLVDHMTNPVAQSIVRGVYHALPNLESFNFKDALVHQLQVPAMYAVQVACYGALYAALAITMASWTFSRREL